MEKSERFKNGKQEKWCSLHNRTSHSIINGFSRRVAVSLRTVLLLLLMVKIGKNMESMFL